MPGALTAIAGSLQGRQLLVGHPARLRGPAPGAPPAASLARQARRLRAPPARSSPASRCPPRAVPGWATGSLAAPSSAPVQPPRADTGAKVNSPSSLPLGCRRLPRQVSFLLQPGPVIQRAASAPRRSDPYRVWGAAPGPRGPAPARPGESGCAVAGPGSPAAAAGTELAARGCSARLTLRVWSVRGGSEPPPARARKTAEDAGSPRRPACCSYRTNSAVPFPLGRWSLDLLSFFFFFYPPSKVASLPPCLQNTGFPFHDKKLRVFAGGARYPSNHSKHNWESPSFRLPPALPLSRAVKNYGPAQLGPHARKPLPARLLRKLNHMGPV